MSCLRMPRVLQGDEPIHHDTNHCRRAGKWQPSACRGSFPGSSCNHQAVPPEAAWPAEPRHSTGPDRQFGKRPDGKRRPLIFHPAGVFFALAAIVAATLPWLWLLPLADPGQAHVRLGIFGFGGMAVSGYLLTAQRGVDRGGGFPSATGAGCPGFRRANAGTGRATVGLAGVPTLAGRRAGDPAARSAGKALGQGAAGSRATRPSDCGGALIWQRIAAAALPLAMGALILAVGGRIAAFLIEEHRRRGLPQRLAAPMWPGLVMMGFGAASSGAIGTSALTITCGCSTGVRVGLEHGPVNQMLCLGHTTLAAGLLGIVAARVGILPGLVQVHLLTMGTMGSMVPAVKARVLMRRVEDIGLMPLTRHWIAMWVIFAATGVRCLAELATPHDTLMTMAGIAWSTAWLLFLSAHLGALRHPAPFPLLSAERARSEPA